MDLLLTAGRNAVPGHLVFDVDVSWIQERLARFKMRGHRITITAILLRAIAIAQQSHPLSRSEMISANRMVTYHDVVGGITIEREVEDQAVVYFGEIDAPHSKSVIEIAQELDEYSKIPIESSSTLALQTLFARLPWFIRHPLLSLAKCIPALRLKCQAATFGLTNLGKYGVTSILSPCVCTSTFAVGAVEERAVVMNRQITIRPSMTLSYNFDLRVLDTNSAAKFVKEIKMLLEGQGGLDKWL